MTDSLFIGLSDQDAPQNLVLKRANRHGLIAGATGTGKTVTLQGLAEGFCRAGVPVFLADVKGDLSGIAMPGSPTFKHAATLEQRAKDLASPTMPMPPARRCSGISMASRATRSARRSRKWGRCCFRG